MHQRRYRIRAYRDEYGDRLWGLWDDKALNVGLTQPTGHLLNAPLIAGVCHMASLSPDSRQYRWIACIASDVFLGVTRVTRRLLTVASDMDHICNVYAVRLPCPSSLLQKES